MAADVWVVSEIEQSVAGVLDCGTQRLLRLLVQRDVKVNASSASGVIRMQKLWNVSVMSQASIVSLDDDLVKVSRFIEILNDITGRFCAEVDLKGV